jgi:hypothetical protein
MKKDFCAAVLLCCSAAVLLFEKTGFKGSRNQGFE